MKTTNYFLFLILLIIISGCKKENQEPLGEENPISEAQIKLTYPLVGDDVHYCCFTFEWEGPSNEKEYRVQIAKFSSFSEILFDTIISGTSLDFPSFLTPRSTYNWRVTALDFELSEKSEFKIVDYSEYLMGSYQSTLKSYSWLLGEGSMDTTYQTNLQMWKGDDHSISYKTDHSSGEMNMPFSGIQKDGYVLYDIDYNNHPTILDYIEYHFEADSIVVYSEISGNGGGGYTRITALRK